MTSILLIIAGIALAAAAAMMTFFYGGGAFDGGSVKAQANTLENAALSVISAARLYHVEKSGLPGDMKALVSAAYLAQKPELKGIGLQSDGWRRLGADENGDGGRLAYVVDDIPGEVCLAILHIHRQDDIAIPSGPTTSPSGCFQASSATDAVFYAYLPSQEQSEEQIALAPEAGRPGTVTGDGGPDAAAAAVRLAAGTVAAAARGYSLAYGQPPMSDADLVPDYVSSMPRMPQAVEGPGQYLGGRGAYRLAIADEAVCLSINASTGIGDSVPLLPATPSEGCYRDDVGGFSYVRPY